MKKTITLAMSRLFIAMAALLISTAATSQNLSLSTYNVDFGISDTAQTQLSQTIYLKNTGTATVNISIDSIGAPASPFSLTNIPSGSIVPGDSLPMDVICNKAMNPGLYQSSFHIYTSAKDTFVTTQIQLSHAASAFTYDDVTYWIGNGSKTAMLVIDFQNATNTGSFAWGYRYDGSATAEDMLNDIAAADTNLNINAAGGFLNDITYQSMGGIGGSPNYWSTWSGTGLHDWQMNFGLSTTLTDSAWFGCSYTDFMPAIIPGLPQPAHVIDTSFLFTDVDFWLGNGPDKAMLVIDFNDSTNSESYAWGIRFSQYITGQEILELVATQDTALNIDTAGGFLNDVTYLNHAGIGGSPNYWSTWTGTNSLDWSMNMGLSTAIINNQWFGLSYTDFNPAIMPSVPQAAQPHTSGLSETKTFEATVFPNPVQQSLTVRLPENISGGTLKLYNLQGQLLFNSQLSNNEQLDVSSLSTGLYILHLESNQRHFTTKIQKL